jgi:glycosyltransferase involved in cell wall biosynthesis
MRDRQAIARFAPRLPCETIPAAVDLTAFPYTPVEEREELSMIMLGNMAWAPNRDAAIWFTNEILPLVVREVPQAVCHLVGDNPPLKHLPAPSANLRIEGRVETIRSFYDRMAIGLIPLRVGGGMRVKMVEMMACGMPIVSTALGAEGNDATPGEHFLRADDAPGFASAIVRLLRDRAERARLSRSAYAFVSEHYSMRDVGRKYEALLIEAMKRQPTGVPVR